MVRSLAAALACVLFTGACEAAHSSAPSPPSTQEVWFESRGVRLGGTLQLPGGRGPHPAVALVHGSGRLTADQMGGNAAALVRMGLAVLAYDKRGVGRSGGEYSGVGARNSVEMFDLLAADAEAAVGWLLSRRDIDASRVGLFGFSQAGWIAPIAASRNERIRFVGLVSGPAVTVGEENAFSDLAGADPGSRQGLSDEEIEREFAAFRGPHGFDPDPAIRAMRVPSLWVIGEADRSIPVGRTLENLERIKRETGRPITVYVFPGMDHGMRNPVTGDRADFWSVVRGWLLQNGIISKPLIADH